MPAREYCVWTSTEEKTLLAGVQKHGLGAWEVIRTDPDFRAVLRARSGVQLKDKWRNLVKFKHINKVSTDANQVHTFSLREKKRRRLHSPAAGTRHGKANGREEAATFRAAQGSTGHRASSATRGSAERSRGLEDQVEAAPASLRVCSSSKVQAQQHLLDQAERRYAGALAVFLLAQAAHDNATGFESLVNLQAAEQDVAAQSAALHRAAKHAHAAPLPRRAHVNSSHGPRRVSQRAAAKGRRQYADELASDLEEDSDDMRDESDIDDDVDAIRKGPLEDRRFGIYDSRRYKGPANGSKVPVQTTHKVVAKGGRGRAPSRDSPDHWPDARRPNPSRDRSGSASKSGPHHMDRHHSHDDSYQQHYGARLSQRHSSALDIPDLLNSLLELNNGRAGGRNKDGLDDDDDDFLSWGRTGLRGLRYRRDTWPCCLMTSKASKGSNSGLWRQQASAQQRQAHSGASWQKSHPLSQPHHAKAPHQTEPSSWHPHHTHADDSHADFGRRPTRTSSSGRPQRHARRPAGLRDTVLDEDDLDIDDVIKGAHDGDVAVLSASDGDSAGAERWRWKDAMHSNGHVLVHGKRGDYAEDHGGYGQRWGRRRPRHQSADSMLPDPEDASMHDDISFDKDMHDGALALTLAHAHEDFHHSPAPDLDQHVVSPHAMSPHHAGLSHHPRMTHHHNQHPGEFARHAELSHGLRPGLTQQRRVALDHAVRNTSESFFPEDDVPPAPEDHGGPAYSYPHDGSNHGHHHHHVAEHLHHEAMGPPGVLPERPISRGVGDVNNFLNMLGLMNANRGQQAPSLHLVFDQAGPRVDPLSGNTSVRGGVPRGGTLMGHHTTPLAESASPHSNVSSDVVAQGPHYALPHSQPAAFPHQAPLRSQWPSPHTQTWGDIVGDSPPRPAPHLQPHMHSRETQAQVQRERELNCNTPPLLLTSGGGHKASRGGSGGLTVDAGPVHHGTLGEELDEAAAVMTSLMRHREDVPHTYSSTAFPSPAARHRMSQLDDSAQRGSDGNLSADPGSGDNGSPGEGRGVGGHAGTPSDLMNGGPDPQQLYCDFDQMLDVHK
ncbi:hypothetical protein WJX73_008774 [Symbiochloris irregularis]|uniref:Myb-like domain-containing protein n=1 Tax=Symbiochloris irregularis TaxID=706552 RepID=A0AAW1NMS6_9CHLO